VSEAASTSRRMNFNGSFVFSEITAADPELWKQKSAGG
jgi:hypothetical protein